MTNETKRLALEVFLSWAVEPNRYEDACAIFEAFVFEAVEYGVERGELLDQMTTIWGEARDLDKEFGEIALRACALRERALETLKAKGS